jgi:hypothetical protein
VTELLAIIGAAIIAIIAAHWKGKRDGKQQATDTRAAQDAAAYSEERKRQDEMDIGIGASDRDRIERLQRIANGGGAGDT